VNGRPPPPMLPRSARSDAKSLFMPLARRPALQLAGPMRIGLRTMGAATTFLRSRFDCTEDEAWRAERKLLYASGLFQPHIDPSRAGDTCDRLQLRLSLSEPELKKVVLTISQVIVYRFDSYIEPKLTFFRRRSASLRTSYGSVCWRTRIA